MFLYIIEGLFAVMVVSVLVTQIIYPLIKGLPIFPVLQKHGIEAKLEQAKQEVRIAVLENELANLKKQAQTVREEGEPVNNG